jgi:hypothetical protein
MEYKHDIGAVEVQLRELDKVMSALSHHREQTAELLHIIKQPGWTTPAEFRFSRAIVSAMVGHGRALAELSDALHAGSREVVEGPVKV